MTILAANTAFYHHDDTSYVIVSFGYYGRSVRKMWMLGVRENGENERSLKALNLTRAQSVIASKPLLTC